MTAKTKSSISSVGKRKSPKTGAKMVARPDVAYKPLKGGDEEIPKALVLFLEVYGRL